ncbi:DUF1905 domain-containing protein [Pedobacter sp. HMF7647]|uniref:DUF1905 domain-containing protein n=1 Tax=Hufsiella arboris TaxID=2695275 RepID=A0A7K1Y9R2_9SPHI|nr:YdeI/OmpD-associated family protein [Hufsiella arboris]MXV51333.1 DUF1905 domain-containing protein [Hufsiella arboris]
MTAQKIKFKAELLLERKTATGIQVPEEIIEQLGNGKRPPVKATINAYTYSSTIGVMDGKFMLPVSASVREKAGVKAGDVVDVELQLDTEPREVEVPADLQQALDENAVAKSFFDTLSNSGKKRFTIPVEQAKAPETRAKRIEKAIADLEKQKKI